MAAYAPTSTANSGAGCTTRDPVNYGRSGYNSKPDDDEEDSRMLTNQGRSGYNKGGKDDDDEE